MHSKFLCRINISSVNLSSPFIMHSEVKWQWRSMLRLEKSSFFFLGHLPALFNSNIHHQRPGLNQPWHLKHCGLELGTHTRQTIPWNWKVQFTWAILYFKVYIFLFIKTYYEKNTVDSTRKREDEGDEEPVSVKILLSSELQMVLRSKRVEELKITILI